MVVIYNYFSFGIVKFIFIIIVVFRDFWGGIWFVSCDLFVKVNKNEYKIVKVVFNFYDYYEFFFVILKIFWYVFVGFKFLYILV